MSLSGLWMHLPRLRQLNGLPNFRLFTFTGSYTFEAQPKSWGALACNTLFPTHSLSLVEIQTALLFWIWVPLTHAGPTWFLWDPYNVVRLQVNLWDHAILQSKLLSLCCVALKIRHAKYHSGIVIFAANSRDCESVSCSMQLGKREAGLGFCKMTWVFKF